MKKLLLLLLLLSLSCAAAVPDTLMGIKTGTPYLAAVRIAMQKGWKVHESTAEGTVFLLRAFDRDSALYIQNYRGRVSVVSVNSPATAYDYVDAFNTIYNGLVQKYGAPTQEIREFHYPFTAGDGHTAAGIRLKKVHISSAWRIGECLVIVRIEPSLNIFLMYAHATSFEAWQKQYDKDKTQGL